MNYKEVLKGKNREIQSTRQAIVTNKLMVKDCATMLGSLKAAIRNANKNGGGAIVGNLTRELNLRRSLVSQITDAQVHNRQLLRESYLLRRAIIDEWVAKES